MFNDQTDFQLFDRDFRKLQKEILAIEDAVKDWTNDCNMVEKALRLYEIHQWLSWVLSNADSFEIFELVESVIDEVDSLFECIDFRMAMQKAYE